MILVFVSIKRIHSWYILVYNDMNIFWKCSTKHDVSIKLYDSEKHI